jgi:hypothetical protein
MATVVKTGVNWVHLWKMMTNLREKDRAEVYALLAYENDYRFAFESAAAISNLGRGALFWVDGKPTALGAFTEHWPGVWNVWMIGTEDFDHCVMPLMRWVRTTAREILDDVGGHRLQCESMSTYKDAHKMIRALGGIEESVMRGRGKNGEDYKMFVWLKGENDQALYPNMRRVA